MNAAMSYFNKVRRVFFWTEMKEFNPDVGLPTCTRVPPTLAATKPQMVDTAPNTTTVGEYLN